MAARSRTLLVSALLVACAATAAVAVAGVPPAAATPPADGPPPEVAPSLAAAPTAESTPAPPRSSVQRAIHVETAEFSRVPDEPGWIEVDVTYDLPADPGKLEVDADSPDVEVVDADGFDDRYVGWTWDGTDTSPTVTVRIRLTTDANARSWVAYGTDEWAIAQPPRLGLRGSVGSPGGVTAPGSPDLSVDGEGVAGTDLVYLGEYEAYGVDDGNERVVLVVPDTVSLPDPPEEVVALIDHASDSLRFGHRPDSGVYHGFVVPDDVRVGLLGRNFGTDTLYFNRFQLDTADGVWVHEYVHSRQEFGALTQETLWLSEGTADYYEPLMVLEQGHVSFEEFRSELQRGQEEPFDEVVVSEPSTWRGPAVRYTHGAAVVAAIDLEIREQTDGDATFQAVMAAWADAETFDQAAFLDAVEEAGGPEARERARELTETTTLPTTWDRETHERLFAGAGAGNPSSSGGDGGLSIRVLDDPSVSIDGPYRRGIAAGPLAVGERVAVVVEIDNGDDESRTVEPTLAIGDRTADTAEVTVPAGETRTVELAATLERSGTHRLTVADFEGEVTVLERAEPRLESAETVADEGSRHVEAVVTAADAGLTIGTYEVRAGDRTIDTGTVVLSPGDERTIRVPLPEDVEGTVTVTVGDASRSVEASPASDGLPGFGPVAALAALVATAAGLAARVRRAG